MKSEKNSAERLEVYKYTAEDENREIVFYYTYPEKSERVVKRVEDKIKQDVVVFDIFPGLANGEYKLEESIWVTTRIQTQMYLPVGMPLFIHDFGTILYGVAEDDKDS